MGFFDSFFNKDEEMHYEVNPDSSLQPPIDEALQFATGSEPTTPVAPVETPTPIMGNNATSGIASSDQLVSPSGQIESFGNLPVAPVPSLSEGQRNELGQVPETPVDTSVKNVADKGIGSAIGASDVDLTALRAQREAEAQADDHRVERHDLQDMVARGEAEDPGMKLYNQGMKAFNDLGDWLRRNKATPPIPSVGNGEAAPTGIPSAVVSDETSSVSPVSSSSTGVEVS